MGRLDRLLGRRVYLDANVLVYALEGTPDVRALALGVLDAVDAGLLSACTGEITLAEVLVVPYRTGAASLVDAYEALLGPASPIDVWPTTAQTWRDAARLRSGATLRLPDAVHLATARQAGAEVFLTHDRRLASLTMARLAVELLAP